MEKSIHVYMHWKLLQVFILVSYFKFFFLPCFHIKPFYNLQLNTWDTKAVGSHEYIIFVYPSNHSFSQLNNFLQSH